MPIMTGSDIFPRNTSSRSISTDQAKVDCGLVFPGKISELVIMGNFQACFFLYQDNNKIETKST